jgi:hypothetical protein
MGEELQRHAIGGRSPSDSSIDDAEKGMNDSMAELMVPSPFVYLGQKGPKGFDPHLSAVSPIHEGITPLSSVPELSLSRPAASPMSSDVKISEIAVKIPSPVKPMISKWILFDLWFNTYRKFFTLVTLLNLTGIILASLGRFPYAENHLGALVLGNLLCAILFRNELFLRVLYFVLIHGLRSVRLPYLPPLLWLNFATVGSSFCQVCGNVYTSTCGRHPFWLCAFRCCVRTLHSTCRCLLITAVGWSSRSSISFGIALCSTRLFSLVASSPTSSLSFPS